MSPGERDLLELSVCGGDGPTLACYGAFAAGAGIMIALARFVVQPYLPGTPGLVMAGGVIGGLVLGAIAYLVVERVYTNVRLAALRAIDGLDVAAVEALLGRRYQDVRLIVRATAAIDREAVAAQLDAAGVAVTIHADGEATVIETGALATSRSTGGIGRYTQFNNYAIYHALRAIAAALPPGKLEVDVEGSLAESE